MIYQIVPNILLGYEVHSAVQSHNLIGLCCVDCLWLYLIDLLGIPTSGALAPFGISNDCMSD